MLAGLDVVYVIIVAKINPKAAPPLSEEDRKVTLSSLAQSIKDTISNRALPGLVGALKGSSNAHVPMGTLLKELLITLLPALAFAAIMAFSYSIVTQPKVVDVSGLQEMGSGFSSFDSGSSYGGGLAEPPGAGGLQEPPGSASGLAEPAGAQAPQASTAQEPAAAEPANPPAPMAFWIILAIGTAILVIFYAIFTFARLEIFKMLLSSFFPLALMITAVLGSIVFGFATPSEAAAMGAFGGILLSWAYGKLNYSMVRESVFLAAKTSAMVCWLFVGSAIFSAAFALLGGQEIINNWVIGMDLTPVEFLILSQVVIFLLGWPLEWTEIIVIFMPIFLPLLNHYGIDPLFFGLLVALNLQTAFLSPPVAMSAFYLKGVSPPHVTLNQIFAGMLPFMGIQILAIVLMYLFPGIGLWLPEVLY
jgi:TRAP-type mannitol/chloroaromatic compound transport system permease large subunit